MARITVKFWRDIPSMVSIGRGRGAARAQLPERFEQAIDRAAMRVGARDDEAYLAEWRDEARAEFDAGAGEDAQTVADRTAAELDRAYDRATLREIVENDGWDPAKSTRAAPK